MLGNGGEKNGEGKKLAETKAAEEKFADTAKAGKSKKQGKGKKSADTKAAEKKFADTTKAGESKKQGRDKKMAVWLVGYAEEERGFWRRAYRWLLLSVLLRFGAKRFVVGELENGEKVGFLELPWTESEFQRFVRDVRRKKLLRALRILRQFGAERIGLPLELYLEFERDLPPQVIDGRELAARVFVWSVVRSVGRSDGRSDDKKMQQSGGVKGREIALLGVAYGEGWQRYFVEELLVLGAQPVLSGSGAAALAEWFWRRRGIAVPVLGARKAIRSCDALILLASCQAGAAEFNRKVFVFREPLVHVRGRFAGRFAFGMFPAGLAAALLSGKDWDNATWAGNVSGKALDNGGTADILLDKSERLIL